MNSQGVRFKHTIWVRVGVRVKVRVWVRVRGKGRVRVRIRLRLDVQFPWRLIDGCGGPGS